jgi:hypothetical protein
LRDAIIMQKLGVNTIRVYNLDTDLDHNQCASIFNAAGIYMLLDVNSGLYGQYIDRTDPSSTYTLDYLEHIFGIVEAFAQYPNTLGFFAANEIINEESSYDAPLYIRAVIRDLKEYIALHAPRSIGVGYAAADVSAVLADTWEYLGCELANSTYSKMDFFGLNDYEWCGDSSYTNSGYDKLVTMFTGTDMPVFFSEYGCNKVTPRVFTEVAALYGDNMNGVLSGGLVYEYSYETSAYGIVVINSSTEVTLLQDYENLLQEYAAIDMASLTATTTVSTAAASTCSAALVSGTATFYNAWDLPSRPSGGDALVTSGLTSASTGVITSVTATTMPATVYNYTGAQVTGLALVQLGCADSNYPGLIADYTATAETCSYATSTGSSSSSSSSSAAAGMAAPPFRMTMNGLVAVGVVLASFLGGMMIL